MLTVRALPVDREGAGHGGDRAHLGFDAHAVPVEDRNHTPVGNLDILDAPVAVHERRRPNGAAGGVGAPGEVVDPLATGRGRGEVESG